MTVSEPAEPAPSAGARATTSRWRPSRAGILNVWRYYDEVFEFHKGRLLLRGPNGTGKSKALELLLPFLFDANLRANRLSTFGSSERTMHWNLMGEGAAGVTRVGYVWLEFQAGDGEWFSCGARLQASRHTSTVHADYFTTGRRIGVDGGLALVNDSGQPLTKAALTEALGADGTVHPTAADHREAVRGALFPDLSEQRFEALITALLQLRTPKLSERLDPNLLSTLLSRALPPLGRTEIAELAEGFERLDRQREHLTRLDAEVRAAEAVADRQRTYAQRVLRATAAGVLSATSELERLSDAAKGSAGQHEQAVADREATEAEKTELAQDAERTQARIDGLADSERYRQGQEPDRLHTEATAAVRFAAGLRDQAEQRAEQAARDAERAESAEHRATSASAAAQRAEQDARRHAERVGLAGAFQEVAGTEDRQRTRRLLRAAVRSRHDLIAEVRAELDRHDAAVAARTGAEHELEQARTDLAAATDRRTAAAEAHDAAVQRQDELVRTWAARLAELPVPGADEVAAHADCRTALLEHLRPGYLAAADGLAQQHAAGVARRQECRDRHAELTARRESLRERADLPPAAPAARTADRVERPGAPLWRLVAFRNGVAPGVQAKVEAALQAAGLLDAWMSPEGVLDVDGHDTFLDPARLHAVDGSSLVEVLRPESAGPVDRDRIWSVLHGIGYGAERFDADAGGRHRGPEADPIVAVAPDGRWRVAGLAGSSDKPEAAHVGAAARDRARRRRIAELDGWIGELDGELAELDTTAEALTRRRDALHAEWNAVPDDAAVQETRRAADVAEAEVAARDDAVSRRAAQVSETAEIARLSGNRLATLAAERGLPADRPALEELDTRVEGFTDSAEVWLDARFEADNDRRTADTAADVAKRAEDIAAERRSEAAAAELAALRLTERADAVRDALDTGHQQALDEMARLRGHLLDLDGQREQVSERLVEIAGRIGSLSNQRAADADRRDAALADRDAAADRLRGRAAAGFADDAGIDLDLSTTDDVTAALAAAREIAATWPKTPHSTKNLTDALGRLNEAIYDSRQVLAERADLELEPDDDVQVFVATLDGVRGGATGLRDALHAERDRARDDITGAERDLFDKTLTGDTRRHLAARIRQAGELVDTMNTRLKRVRTASKVAVQLVWDVDPNLPAGTQTARELLLTDPAQLTGADKDALHDFFRDRIDEAKQDNAAASWEGQLAQVFDYTAWHRFGVKIDRANGDGWQLLTKRLHGALSGGEKAIALHLPLFAAVAAHYQAVPAAPRFILLDEVFVGVDATNRGQVFDLLTALDLDLVLTSDHEWCTYRELDGIAIHQLITGDGDDAVTTARFVWDGRALAEQRGAS
ncbi:TIGR02680 family protein [Saccharopolyspora sp. NFXS83]|uniref:TIGR02680 family protein n=1 Tax=Saccharopolyspora sp. NFXS83 TaxID=2993560 RepID=UPI00224B842D|nr:TIGR02680 family protein [Saccharopolyspora sp. NFXS83]MCX2729079.1 TIGR02680 family protein [Saccharopolyspora sp. NFXS83]